MPDQDRPNLFSYATSELSQDAFICWLAAWAKPENIQYQKKHQLGVEFISSMLRKKDELISINRIDYLDIKRQYTVKDSIKKGRIDIVISLNYSDSNNLIKKAVIIIEDKVDAGLTEHQLKNYIDTINEDENYVNREKHFIFLKTGYYDTLITSKEFNLFNRSDFAKTLKLYTGKNEIILDYSLHLQLFDYKLSRFKRDPLPQESRPEDPENRYYWIGFHKWLLESNKLYLSYSAGYGYVNNAAGCFNGFWWNFEASPQGDYWSYVQLENERLCYKIGFSDVAYETENWREKAQTIKSIWSDLLLKLDEDSTAKHTKIGKTMTIARKADGVKVFPAKTDGTLDLDKTIQKLLEAQEVLIKARQLVAVAEQA